MQLSLETFNHAVALKRNGDYEGALRIYRGELDKMLEAKDFHEFTTYAHAMAKCYYLKNDYTKAALCYDAILAMNVLVYPVLQGYVKRDPQFFNFAAGWAPHIGYTLKGWDSDYAGAIAGRGNSYASNKYMDEGFGHIVDFMNDILKHNSRNYVRDIFFSNIDKIRASY